jgi:predicted nucleic acid-binding protein
LESAVILVDTNIFLDLLKRDAHWMTWSAQQLRQGRLNDQLAINMVVYAELAGYPQKAANVDQLLDELGVITQDIQRPTARAAAQAFNQFRQRDGKKTGVLPDFFIGAQALTEGWSLLTRDAARYKTYFPKIKLICP